MFVKRITAFLCVLALALPAQAAERIFTFNDFSKGQNSHISPYLIQPNQGVLCRNVRINDQYGSLSKRPVMVLLADGGTASINGMHRYYKSDGTSRTIWATGTGLYYNASGTATALETGFTSGAWWQYVTYQDVAIGWNGSDQPVKWDGSTSVTDNTDGHRTSGSLVAELGAPFAELNTGANLDASSWYQYKIAYYDGSNYQYSSARSNPIKTGAAVRDIYLTDIPIGESGTTHRYIYRTLGNSSKANCLADETYYLVGSIADNSTSVYADTTTDDTADDDSAPTWSTAAAGTDVTPPAAKLGGIHRERLFLANTATEPSYLFWSDEFNPDVFNAADYEPIREDDGDEITFVLEYGGVEVIGKDNSILHFYTDATDDATWYSSPPFSFVGCAAPYSAAVTPRGIIYYGRKGLYRYFGQPSQLISDAVTDLVRDVATTAIPEAVGYYYNNEYNFSYTSDESGDAANNRVLVYDIIRDAYVLDYKNINCFTSFTASTDFGALYSGSSGTDGYIYAHEFEPSTLRVRYKSDLDAGTYDDVRSTGTEIAPAIELGWDCTIDGWLTELQTKAATISTIDDIETYLPDAIIDRPDTDGTWTSEIYDINAGAYDRLYWREDLNTSGDVTWQIRAATATASVAAASWSTAVTDPSGADVSSVTAARYTQLRANLSTTDIDYSPELATSGSYLMELVYSKTGSTLESDFVSEWQSGWKDIEPAGGWKELRRIKVFYTGDRGTINLRYYNEEGDIDNNFDIDLTVEPDDNPDDEYEGVGDTKVFTEYCPANEEGLDPLGRLWWFEISEEGSDEWKIQKIEVKYRDAPEID